MALDDVPYSLLTPKWLGDSDSDEGETDSTASFIGIIVAISGNILISLALNCQKLAHKRLERERRPRAVDSSSTRQSPGVRRHDFDDNREEATARNNVDVDVDADDDEDEDDERTRVGESSQHHSPNSDAESEYGEAIPFPRSGAETPSSARQQRSFRDRAPSLLLETQPLLVSSHTAAPKNLVRGGYRTVNRSPGASTEVGEGSWRARTTRSRSSPHLLSRIFATSTKGKAKSSDIDLEGSDAPVEVRVGNGDSIGERSTPKIKFAEPKLREENESDYLKSKLWWLGFLLMSVGEMGNFISYAFAPASIVAPLGTFALIANCFFAPLMLRERFRNRDLFGILLAALGAITIVLSASSSDRRLDPDALIHAITQQAFIILAILYAAGAALLVSLSSQRIGQEHVWVDVGACALFGGFTVLSTKAFSSLLTKEWAAVFKEWITYPVVAVLIGTAIGQIRYLNRALMKFDSKVVIPAQFVFFNISAIIGSAVLYGDFRSASLHQMVTFLYGCGATFLGVFMLTWGTAERKEDALHGPEEEERTQFVLPAVTASRPMPLVRAKTSSLTLSPAQRALLSNTSSN